MHPAQSVRWFKACKPSAAVCWFFNRAFFRVFSNGKYCILNRDNLTQSYQMKLSKKQPKKFPHFFVHFWNLDQILDILIKKMTLIGMYFQNYRLRKTWLCKCLKMLVLEDLSTSNMLNGPIHFLSFHRSTFNISLINTNNI